MYNPLRFFFNNIFCKQYLIKYRQIFLISDVSFSVYFLKSKTLPFMVFYNYLFYEITIYIKGFVKGSIAADNYRILWLLVYLTPKHGYSKILIKLGTSHNSLFLTDLTHSVYNPFYLNILNLKEQRLKIAVDTPNPLFK